jgi:2-hydroxy-3-keto-5-methylthiopentenyl-1-phosphate phosphatase
MQNSFAIVFDFDDTLAPDSTSSFIDTLGVDVKAFWKKANDRVLHEGWDPIPVYLHQMIELSNNQNFITKESLLQHGLKVELFKGVKEFFPKMESFIHQIDKESTLEFYLLSSGVGDILKNTPIAEYFKAIWACDFCYDKDDVINGVKNVVSFTEKTRFLFHISKGSVESSRSNPGIVNEKMVDDFRIPMKNIIYIGDGLTDVPCFALVKRMGGYAAAVMPEHKKPKWEKAWGLLEDQRVDILLPADFSEGSTLYSTIQQELKKRIRDLKND